KNLGTFAARNAGVKAAGGGYLLFLDPDDYLELDICKIALENICDCNLLSFSYVKIDNNNYEIFSAKWKDYNSYLKLIKKKKFTPWNLCNLIVKKDFYIQKINSFSSERLLLAEDMLVFSFLVDCKMKAIEYVGYYYVINSNSITCLNKIEDNLKQYEKILELINNSNIEQKIKKYYSYFLNNSILDCKYKLNLINIIHYKLVKFVFYLQKKLRF
ncbi:glycosyltransferase family 2 protein, partial [Campylobacter canadensis]